MPESHVELKLSRDEALVLYEWLCTRDKGVEPELTPEVQVLWKLEGQLDKILVEPFAANYQEMLDQARRRIRGQPG